MTIANSKNTKLSTLILLLLILLFLILGVFYMLNNNKKPKPVINTNNNSQQTKEEPKSVITDQNEYINYKYNFGLSFPDYWKGFSAQENDKEIKFSLKNKKGEYVPIFRIGAYTEDEISKAMEKTELSLRPYVMLDENGIFAYSMERNDPNLLEFGDVFVSSSYSGLLFDIQNNIIPTFKFIRKGEVVNEKNRFQKDNEFKLADVKVGDIIAEMKVKFIRSFEGYDIPPNYLSVNDLSIGFSGETTITGAYQNRKTDPYTGADPKVCFGDLDEQSKDKIPSIIWSVDYGVFCFSNQNLARESFSPEGSTGIATIVIDDYTINKLPAEVTDMARLVKVISKD
jgi:hypothetical protein